MFLNTCGEVKFRVSPRPPFICQNICKEKRNFYVCIFAIGVFAVWFCGQHMFNFRIEYKFWQHHWKVYGHLTLKNDHSLNMCLSGTHNNWGVIWGIGRKMSKSQVEFCPVLHYYTVKETFTIHNYISVFWTVSWIWNQSHLTRSHFNFVIKITFMRLKVNMNLNVKPEL